MLTDLACKSLIIKSKQLKKPLKKSDGKGLFLYAFPKGTAYWRHKYRLLGKENQISFGSYPEITLSEARRKHTEAYKLLIDGIDPAKARKEALQLALLQAQNMFETVGRDWFQHNLEKWSADHAQQILRVLEKDLFCSIGKLPVVQLTRRQVLEAVQLIERRGAHEVARRSLQHARNILNYARNKELVQINVADGLEGALKPYKTGNFPSMDIEMLPDFLRKLRGSNAICPDARQATELLMLTLVRRSELLKASWSEFDLQKAVWVIPAERMKMRREHIVPLSDWALRILKERKAINDALPVGFQSEYVFPGKTNPIQPVNEKLVSNALHLLGYKGIHSAHGFRALGMGIAKEKLGYRHEVPDRQLAHAPANEVDRAYDRAKFLPERVEMMQRLADYCLCQ